MMRFLLVNLSPLQSRVSSILKRYILLLLVLFWNLVQIGSAAIPPPPSPPKLVNDYCQLLSSAETNQLENDLVAYNDSTSSQIAVVVVCDLDGMEISDFGTRLFEQWKIGQKGKDNGILLLIAKNDRKINITTGYGVEDKLTDALCRRIIERDIKPNFKSGNFALGISNGVESIKKVLLGQYKAEKKRKEFRLPANSFLILIIVILYLIFKFGGRSGGGGTGFGSGGRYHYRPPIFFGGGGSFGGGGFSGGGFGGFGGGRTGGGGASGSW